MGDNYEALYNVLKQNGVQDIGKDAGELKTWMEADSARLGQVYDVLKTNDVQDIGADATELGAWLRYNAKSPEVVTATTMTTPAKPKAEVRQKASQPQMPQRPSTLRQAVNTNVNPSGFRGYEYPGGQEINGSLATGDFSYEAAKTNLMNTHEAEDMPTAGTQLKRTKKVTTAPKTNAAVGYNDFSEVEEVEVPMSREESAWAAASERFGRTQQGKQLNEELNSTYQELHDKYMQSWLETDAEAKRIASFLHGQVAQGRMSADDASRSLDDAFMRSGAGQKMSEVFAPYNDQYNAAIGNRYGKWMDQKLHDADRRMIDKLFAEMDKREKHIESERAWRGARERSTASFGTGLNISINPYTTAEREELEHMLDPDRIEKSLMNDRDFFLQWKEEGWNESFQDYAKRKSQEYAAGMYQRELQKEAITGSGEYILSHVLNSVTGMISTAAANTPLRYRAQMSQAQANYNGNWMEKGVGGTVALIADMGLFAGTEGVGSLAAGSLMKYGFGVTARTAAGMSWAERLVSGAVKSGVNFGLYEPLADYAGNYYMTGDAAQAYEQSHLFANTVKGIGLGVTLAGFGELSGVVGRTVASKAGNTAGFLAQQGTSFAGTTAGFTASGIVGDLIAGKSWDDISIKEHMIDAASLNLFCMVKGYAEGFVKGAIKAGKVTVDLDADDIRDLNKAGCQGSTEMEVLNNLMLYKQHMSVESKREFMSKLPLGVKAKVGSIFGGKQTVITPDKAEMNPILDDNGNETGRYSISTYLQDNLVKEYTFDNAKEANRFHLMQLDRIFMGDMMNNELMVTVADNMSRFSDQAMREIMENADLRIKDEKTGQERRINAQDIMMAVGKATTNQQLTDVEQKIVEALFPDGHNATQRVRVAELQQQMSEKHGLDIKSLRSKRFSEMTGKEKDAIQDYNKQLDDIINGRDVESIEAKTESSVAKGEDAAINNEQFVQENTDKPEAIAEGNPDVSDMQKRRQNASDAFDLAFDEQADMMRDKVMEIVDNRDAQALKNLIDGCENEMQKKALMDLYNAAVEASGFDGVVNERIEAEMQKVEADLEGVFFDEEGYTQIVLDSNGNELGRRVESPDNDGEYVWYFNEATGMPTAVKAEQTRLLTGMSREEILANSRAEITERINNEGVKAETAPNVAGETIRIKGRQLIAFQDERTGQWYTITQEEADANDYSKAQPVSAEDVVAGKKVVEDRVYSNLVFQPDGHIDIAKSAPESVMAIMRLEMNMTGNDIMQHAQEQASKGEGDAWQAVAGVVEQTKQTVLPEDVARQHAETAQNNYEAAERQKRIDAAAKAKAEAKAKEPQRDEFGVRTRPVLDKKGKPTGEVEQDWEAGTPQESVQGLINMFGIEDTGRQYMTQYIDKYIERYTKEIEKLSEPSKMADDPRETVRLERERKVALAEAERKLKHWQEAKAEYEKLTHTTPEELAQMQKELNGEYGENMGGGVDESEVTNGFELALRTIGRAEFKIDPESYRKHTGYGTAEQKKMVGLFSKDGLTMEQIAEKLVEMDQESYNGALYGGDTSKAMTDLLDAFGAVRTRGGVKEYFAERGRRLSDAERERNKMENDRYAQEMGYDSYEDMLAEREARGLIIAERAPGADAEREEREDRYSVNGKKEGKQEETDPTADLTDYEKETLKKLDNLGTLRRLAEFMGKKIVIDNGIVGEGLTTDDGVIRINAKAGFRDNLIEVLGHELTHTLEDSDGKGLSPKYQALFDSVIGSKELIDWIKGMDGYADSIEGEVARRQQLYKDAYQQWLQSEEGQKATPAERAQKLASLTLSEDAARREIVADFVGRVMLQDADMVRRMIVPEIKPETKGHWQKVLDRIKEFLNIAKGTEMEEPLSQTYQVLKEAIEYQKDKTIESSREFDKGKSYDEESVNRVFNEELQKQINNPESMSGHVYRLGKPSEKLLATGFPADQVIEMSAAHLKEKSEAAQHPFPLEAMTDLVKALRNPIAVFAYGKDGSKAQNAIVEIQYDGDNFLIGVHFGQEKNGNIIADIRGVFPKYNHEWISWITKEGKLLGVDKSRVLPIIEDTIDLVGNEEKFKAYKSKRPTGRAEVTLEDLESAAKVVKDFGTTNKNEIIFDEIKNNSVKFSISDSDKVVKAKPWESDAVTDNEVMEQNSAEVSSARYSLVKKDDIENASESYFHAYYEGKGDSRFAPVKKQETPITRNELETANLMIREMADIMLPYLNQEQDGKRYLPEEVYGKGVHGQTIMENGSYGKTMENTTICLRTLSYNDFVDNVKKKLGRPLTQTESFLASQMVYEIAKDPQCLYCYVSLDRKAYDDFLLRYIDERDNVLGKFDSLPEGKKKFGRKKPNEALPELYQEFLNGRKDTEPMRNRFNMWINAYANGEAMVKPEDLVTAESRQTVRTGEDKGLMQQMKDAEQYAQSASWSKKNIDYRSYTGELLKLSKGWIDKLTSEYGLRFYSFSEYTPAFIVENMQMVRDAALRGLKGLAYTKELDFAKIFAPTGLNINCSMYGRRDAEGNIVADTRQGADWNEVKELREKHPNIGGVFVATDDAMVEWALAQNFIDVVIPFHIVRTGQEIADFYGWTNYSKDQADKNEKGHTKYISPAEHHNDKATFLELCQKEGYTPRFSQWIDNPNYMKLVNETRRSVDETGQIKPIFNLDAAKESFAEFVDKGGYYGGWWEVDDAGYHDAVNTVVDDVKAGKKANEVEYGRQDMPVNTDKMMAAARKHRQHGNTPLSLGQRNSIASSAEPLTREPGESIEDFARRVTERNKRNSKEARFEQDMQTEVYSKPTREGKGVEEYAEQMTKWRTAVQYDNENHGNERFSIVKDPEVKSRLQEEFDGKEYTINDVKQMLEDGKTEKDVEKGYVMMYRAARIGKSGKAYSPKMTKLAGEANEIFFNEIEQSDERPELSYPVQLEDGTTVYKVNLDGGNPAGEKLNKKSRSTDGVDYNPYLHLSSSVMNDQFTAAYAMPEMGVIAVKVPLSEFFSQYKADRAASTTGILPWHSGTVQGKLKAEDKRIVALSRYDMPVGIVEPKEVARQIAEQLKNADAAMPYNLVTPEVAEWLLRYGAKVDNKPSGTVGKGQNEEWMERRKRVESEMNDPDVGGNGGNRYSVSAKKRNEDYLAAVEKGDTKTTERLVQDAAKEAMPETKVVDKNGMPLKVYHGTNHYGFTVFDTSLKRNKWNMGSHFGSEDAAAEFTDEKTRKVITKMGTYSVYLNIKNPWETSDWYFKGDPSVLTEVLKLVNENGTNEVRQMWNELYNMVPHLKKRFSEEDILNNEQGDFNYEMVHEWKDSQHESFYDKVREIVEACGYDGIKYYNGTEGEGGYSWIALHPEQIKSAEAVTYDNNGKVIPLSERFNEEKKDIRYSVSAFYSNAAKAVEDIKQTKGTGEQWLAMLKKNGGLKAEEDKWIGLSEWLKDKKSVTKDEIQKFIAENDVKVEEVHYADIRDVNLNNVYDALDAPATTNATRLKYTTEGLTNKREIALTVPNIESYNESDKVHFGDAGNGRAVAWLRFGDATDADGNKVLVIDEIQSKRHQDGREKGYQGDASKQYKVGEYETKTDKFGEYKEAVVYDADGNRAGTMVADESGYTLDTGSKKLTGKTEAEVINETFDSNNAVPDAPFQKNWHELAMKRALRYAAENGYDKVAWTTGTQQAERYELRKQLDSIEYFRNEDGTYFAFYILKGRKDGNTVGTKLTEKELVENFGKDIADKIISGEKSREREVKSLSGKSSRILSILEGDNLVIGGEGMKGFYDQMLPRYMDKYGKKWGVSTHDIKLNLPNEADQVMHAVDVNDAMRESVMQGQPRFSITDVERKNIGEYDKENNTQIGEFLDYVAEGWSARSGKWKIAKIKHHGFPSMIEAAKHGKLPVVGDLYVDNDTLNPNRHHLYLRDANGNVLHDNDGNPIKDPEHEISQEEWTAICAYLTSEEKKIIATRPGTNIDSFVLYPPFRHHSGLPMAIVLKQMDYTKRNKNSYLVTAYGEKDENTRNKTFLYGSYEKVKGIPAVRVAQTVLDSTTPWRTPLTDRKVSDNVSNYQEILEKTSNASENFSNERNSISAKSISQQVRDLRDEVRNMPVVTDEALKKIQEITRKELTQGGAAIVGKRDINAILSRTRQTALAAMFAPKNEALKRRLDSMLEEVRDICVGADLKAETQELIKLLNTQTHGKNQKGVTVAKNVDANTADIMEQIQSTFKSYLTVEKDAEIRTKGREIRQAKEDLDALRGNGADQADIDAKEAEVATLEAEQNALKAEREQMRADQVNDSRQMIEADQRDMEAQLDEMVRDGITPSREFLNKYDSIPLRMKMIEMREAQIEYEQTLKQAEEDLSALYSRYNGRLTKEEREQRDAQEKAIYDNVYAMRDQLYEKTMDMRQTMDELITEGRSNLQEQRARIREHKQNLISMAIKAAWRKKPMTQLEEKSWLEEKVIYAKNWIHSGIDPWLWSLAHALKMVDINHDPDHSTLFEHFIMNEEGLQAANDSYYKGLQAATETVDAKVAEIFGEGWDVDKLNHKCGKEYVNIPIMANDNSRRTYGIPETTEDGKMYNLRMKKSNLLYAWMVWQMKDGRKKLEAQGFTEDVMNNIVRDELGDGLVEFADWVQEEFLPGLRDNKYDPIHKKVYGIGMAKVEHYFPFKIDTRQLPPSEMSENGPTLKLSATPGALIERNKHGYNIDLSNSAFDVLSQNLNDMERFAAYQPAIDDLNTILSSPTFKAALEARRPGSLNAKGERHGGMYQSFVKACEVATGSNRDNAPAADAMLQSVTSKAITTAMMLNTSAAIKQYLSLPAGLIDDKPLKYYPIYLALFAKNALTGITPVIGHMQDKGIQDELVSMQKRWEKTPGGIIQLADATEDAVQNFLGKVGMYANKYVDRKTCATIAKTKIEFGTWYWEKQGLSHEDALYRAKREAIVAVQSFQQSSDDHFAGEIQKSKSAIGKMFTAFQNSPMSYARMFVEALWKIRRNCDSYIFNDRLKHYQEQGDNDGTAWLKALGDSAEGVASGVGRAGVYGSLNFAWNIANPLITAGMTGMYLLIKAMLGDDDDKREAKRGMAATGEYLSSKVDDARDETLLYYLIPQGTAYGFLVNLGRGMVGKDNKVHDKEALMGLDAIQTAIANGIAISQSEDGWTAKNTADYLRQNATYLVGIPIDRLSMIAYGISQMFKNGEEPWVVDLAMMLSRPKSETRVMTDILMREKGPEAYAEAMRKVRMYCEPESNMQYFGFTPVSQDEDEDKKMKRIMDDYRYGLDQNKPKEPEPAWKTDNRYVDAYKFAKKVRKNVQAMKDGGKKVALEQYILNHKDDVEAQKKLDYLSHRLSEIETIAKKVAKENLTPEERSQYMQDIETAREEALNEMQKVYDGIQKQQ